MPSEAMSRWVNCGQSNFRCHRKDRYGLNMQAICDDLLRFRWIDINWPGSSSDYMAWVTSSLHRELEDNAITKIILEGMTLVGDNAYIKKSFMAVPLKGKQSGYCDAYNYYQSQLRITIERAFGVLVHRWAILRSPICVPLPKVSPMVLCLCRLHNFCIDRREMKCGKVDDSNWKHLHKEVRRYQEEEGGDASVVEISKEGNRPSSLLNQCHHFLDAEKHRKTDQDTPMDAMIKEVKEKNLQRRKPRSRS